MACPRRILTPPMGCVCLYRHYWQCLVCDGGVNYPWCTRLLQRWKFVLSHKWPSLSAAAAVAPGFGVYWLVHVVPGVLSVLPTIGLRSAIARSFDFFPAPSSAIPIEDPFDPSLQVISSSSADIVHQVFGKAQKPLSCPFSRWWQGWPSCRIALRTGNTW